jgi:DNA-binding transcriptional ArsR family regulator
MMLQFQVSGTVAHAVRDEPRTVSELAEDLDLTESRVKRALSVLAEKDMIYCTDDTYHASEYMTDKLSPVKRFVRWVPRRLARPFRMEQRTA